MADKSNYQKKIIQNYYDNKDTILVERLQTSLSELYLATTDKKKNALWTKIEKALRQTSAHTADIEATMEKRDIQYLAKLIQELF